MKINATVIAGVIFAVLAIIIFSSVALRNDFPVFHATAQNSTLVDINLNVGAEDSRFMWNNDGLALIAQAIALFAAAAATIPITNAPITLVINVFTGNP